MISFIKGKIIIKREKFVVLEMAGIGFKVFLSAKNMLKLKENQDIKLFTFLDVRETSLNLYGFLNYEELEFFEILNSVRGVGPKAALEISSIGSLESIKQRILANDEKLFEAIPGIGRKKAGAIILELSGKIKDISKKEKPAIIDEAEQALIDLGFSRHQAKQALNYISKDIKDPEQRLKQALRFLGKNRA